MKLYTEEQVDAIINRAGLHKQRTLRNITPIELPSDEEINKKMYPFNDDYVCGFIAAIEMIEEQIKQQDNDNTN